MATISRQRLKEIVKEVLKEESEYQTFFKKALEKAGKSITAMSDDEKKEFFNKIDAAWSGRGEKNEELVGNQHKLDVDGDGEIEASDLATLRAGEKKEESVNEAVSSKDMDKIKAAVEASTSFMNVGANLKKAGLRYVFATSPMPIYIVQPTPNNKVAIVNKKYASGPDFVHGDIAVGVMESKLTEEEIKWNAVQNAIINFLKANTKILDKRVQAKDTEGVKGGLKSIISGLTNAQKSLNLESVNEAASRTAMEIGGLTGLNKDAIQKFVDTHNMDIEKVYQYVKKSKLTDRLNFVTAIVGTPGNPVQKKIIKMFGESVNEISYDSQGNLKVKKQYKSLSDYEQVAKKGDFIWVGRNANDFKGAGKEWLSKVLGKDSEGNVILTPFGKNKKHTIPQKNQMVIVVEGLNEEFKHLISVDTPTQAVSKKVAAEVEALAKKGVRSKDIGLKMGFVGNQKAATDAFQKLKNQIYFKLDKRESVNEGRAFINAAKKAKAEGKTEFEFNGKTYPVTIKD